ncbi:MAG: hydroxymethylbilane synthase [Planctomycetaceae bacterium]|nr:hydroxymethylbilane synthase [Planctomycetaceae bacterium]
MAAPQPTGTIRLATRASRLALWQAHHVANLLRQAVPDVAVELVEVSTVGDRDLASRLAAMGGQGVFTREVQAAVLDGRADVAVHSLKDLPTETAAGLLLAGVPTRGPRWDSLVAPVGKKLESIDDLPAGARVATGSLRRRAQLLNARPDLVLCEVRGNVETRLRKLDDGEFDAMILAEAGLERLDLAGRISGRLAPPLMLPAVGQAALGLECRDDDSLACELLGRLTDPVTFTEVMAERACLRTLRAGCHAPVGVLTTMNDANKLSIEAVVLSPDGQERIHAVMAGAMESPESVGEEIARQLAASGADRLLNPPPVAE